MCGVSEPLFHLRTYWQFNAASDSASSAASASDSASSPAQVNTGESVTISVQVANTGDLSGSYKVTLKVNNVTEADKDITVVGGTTQTVIFTTAKDTDGTYTVNVNGLLGTFTVKTPVVPPTPINWWLIGGIIAGVIIIGLVVWQVRRRMY
ncbi:MAG: hypothetical protein HYU83_03940 [Chloroflexi bacterium]|nr:hypothetical protein [Chloroflexota bacterium]